MTKPQSTCQIFYFSVPFLVENIIRNGAVANKEDVKFPPVQKGTHQNLIGQANLSPLKTNRVPVFSENGKVVESKIPLREKGS